MHRYTYERTLHESAGHVVKLWRDNNSGVYIVTKERLDDTSDRDHCTESTHIDC